jgi:hypothetical protein
MTELIDFLTDAVSNMESFRDDISTIYVFEESAKRLVATGNHPKMMILYRVVPNVDLTTELTAPAYLGALQYLRSLLGSDLMKGGSMEVEYKEQHGKMFANSMRFFSEHVDSNFECTNPTVIDEKDRKTQFGKLPDALNFPFTKDMRKQFDEVARMNTPKADTRLFTLVFDGKFMRAVFGTGKHTTSLVLTDQVTGNTDQKLQKQISLDRFRPMIRLASENTGQASFHEKAFWVEFQTPHALHMIVTPTIRDQTR